MLVLGFQIRLHTVINYILLFIVLEAEPYSGGRCVGKESKF
jgi:hypothetical protein